MVKQSKTIEQYREMNSILLQEKREFKDEIRAKDEFIKILQRENCQLKKDLIYGKNAKTKD
jgi:hypothetical protein